MRIRRIGWLLIVGGTQVASCAHRHSIDSASRPGRTYSESSAKVVTSQSMTPLELKFASSAWVGDARFELSRALGSRADATCVVLIVDAPNDAFEASVDVGAQKLRIGALWICRAGMCTFAESRPVIP